MAERKSFLLRIDPALWADLEAWAQDELRSVNGQIEYLLKQAVAKRKGGAGKAASAEEPLQPQKDS
ncbi:MAG: Arc family DNA-binding protein [Acidobacteriia bacterium]|nr:Arc family DNA-binding protein [Terriglobia bacterium]